MISAIKQTVLFHFFKINYYAWKNYYNRRLLITYCRDVLYGKDVYLIGSGPSAKTITTIPPNAIVACCNFSPEAVKTVLDGRSIDVYLTSMEALSEGGVIERVFNNYQIDYCIHNFSSKASGQILCKSQFFLPQDISITKMITADLTYKEIADIYNNGENTILSSGMQLLSYILLSNPKSVTLAGIDTDISVSYFDNLSYKADTKDVKRNNHYSMDKRFLERIAKKYKNIHVPDSSPIKSIFDGKQNENLI